MNFFTTKNMLLVLVFLFGFFIIVSFLKTMDFYEDSNENFEQGLYEGFYESLDENFDESLVEYLDDGLAEKKEEKNMVVMANNG